LRGGPGFRWVHQSGPKRSNYAGSRTSIANGADGTKSWYRNGHLHRDHGPAIEHANGTKEWYRNGQPLAAKEITEIQQRVSDQRLLQGLTQCPKRASA